MWVSDVWAHTGKQRLTLGVESFESSTLLSGWETLTLGHRKNEKVGDLFWAPVTISTMAGAPHTALSGPSFGNKGLFLPDLLLCFLNLQSQVSHRIQNHTLAEYTVFSMSHLDLLYAGNFLDVPLPLSFAFNLPLVTLLDDYVTPTNLYPLCPTMDTSWFFQLFS